MMVVMIFYHLHKEQQQVEKLSISLWFKRCGLPSQEFLFETWIDNNNRFDLRFNSDDFIISNTSSGSDNLTLTTDRKFRDTNAWYHVVASIDTTQATASNRVKMYVNGGSRNFIFSTSLYASQNADLALGTSSYTNFLGKYSSSGLFYFDGYISEYVFIDGQALDKHHLENLTKIAEYRALMYLV